MRVEMTPGGWIWTSGDSEVRVRELAEKLNGATLLAGSLDGERRLLRDRCEELERENHWLLLEVGRLELGGRVEEPIRALGASAGLSCSDGAPPGPDASRGNLGAAWGIGNGGLGLSGGRGAARAAPPPDRVRIAGRRLFSAMWNALRAR